MYICMCAHRAAAHMYLQDYAKAKEDCKIAVEKNPGYAKAYHRLGLVYFIAILSGIHVWK